MRLVIGVGSALVLVISSACSSGGSSSSSPAGDCRQAANACSPGFTCSANDGKWQCVPDASGGAGGTSGAGGSGATGGSGGSSATGGAAGSGGVAGSGGAAGAGGSVACAANSWQAPKQTKVYGATADSKGNAYFLTEGGLLRYVAASDTWEGPVAIPDSCAQPGCQQWKTYVDRDGVVINVTASGVTVYSAASGSSKIAPLPSCGKPDGGRPFFAGVGGDLVATCGSTGGFADAVVHYDAATSTWSSPATLGAPGPKQFGGPVPDVAFGPNGEAIVAQVYRSYGSDPSYTSLFTWYVSVLRWTPSLGWGAPEPIASEKWATQNGKPLASSTDAGDPFVRFDHSGNALLVWGKRTPYSTYVFTTALSAARYSKAAKAWVATAGIPVGHPLAIDDLFVDDNDVMTLFWNDSPFIAQTSPMAVSTDAFEPTTGLWQPKLTVGDGNGAASVNGLGNAFVVSVPGNGKPGLLARYRQGASGTWSTAVQLDPTLGPGANPVGVVALGGCRAAAYWFTNDQGYLAEFR